VEHGELATCGVNLHTKKAVVKPLQNYYIESEKHLGYTKPALDETYVLVSCVWIMRHGPLTIKGSVLGAHPVNYIQVGYYGGRIAGYQSPGIEPSQGCQLHTQKKV
jgi:hypothetical protein